MIPNVEMLETQLRSFCDICKSDEVVLFERATFLVVAHATHKQHSDMHRFEKISNIIKQFKLSCSKSACQFASMQVQNSMFTAFIDGFTAHTYIMVVTSDPVVQPAATLMNIETARSYFDKLTRESTGAA